MKRVRMRHPLTGGTFDAPESAVATYAASGWEVVGSPVEGSAAPSPDAVRSRSDEPEPAPAEEQAKVSETKTPRGRRTSKED